MLHLIVNRKSLSCKPDSYHIEKHQLKSIMTIFYQQFIITVICNWDPCMGERQPQEPPNDCKNRWLEQVYLKSKIKVEIKPHVRNQIRSTTMEYYNSHKVIPLSYSKQIILVLFNQRCNELNLFK